MGRCKRHCTMMEKRSKAQEKKEQKAYDELAQKWNCVEWEQEEALKWRKELKTREIAVAASEVVVFQRELEYRRMERCPFCGKKGKGEAQHQGGQGRSETIANKMATSARAANKAVIGGRQETIIACTHAGKPLQHALGCKNKEGPVWNTKGCTETWAQTCIAWWMTPQRSPFLWGDARAGVEVHTLLPRRRTPYPRFVTIGARAKDASRRQVEACR